MASLGHTGGVNESQVTESNFVNRLLAAVPELAPVVDEHLADSEGKLLLHLLVADVLRFSSGAFDSGDRATASKVLTFMSAAFENADGNVGNAIAGSFVEHVGALPNETAEFIASWPKPLLDERDRQLNWRPTEGR